MHLLVIVRFDAACCCNGMPLPSLPQHSFPMWEKKTTVMSNRLARSPKRTKLFWNAHSWLLLPAADQNSRESGSSSPEPRQADELPWQRVDRSPATPQMATPALFVSWQDIAQLNVPVEHEAPVEDLRTIFQKAIPILPTQHQRQFLNCKARHSIESPKEEYQLKLLPP